MAAFELTETQTNYILEMPLRRLTKFSRIELEAEADELRRTIESLTQILEGTASWNAWCPRNSPRSPSGWVTRAAPSCWNPTGPTRWRPKLRSRSRTRRAG